MNPACSVFFVFLHRPNDKRVHACRTEKEREEEEEEEEEEKKGGKKLDCRCTYMESVIRPLLCDSKARFTGLRSDFDWRVNPLRELLRSERSIRWSLFVLASIPRATRSNTVAA